jgi:hypothetical protein
MRTNVKTVEKLQVRNHNSQHEGIGQLREGGKNVTELIGNLRIEKGSL